MLPKIIHQIWIGPYPIPLEFIRTVKDKHPGWKHYLWTDKNIPHLQNEILYRGAHDIWALKADIICYELLQMYGGIYIDADWICLSSLDAFLDKELFVWNYPSKSILWNGIIGVPANHPAMAQCIAAISLHADKVLAASTSMDAVQWTGPRMLHNIWKYLQPRPDPLPSSYFLPEIPQKKLNHMTLQEILDLQSYPFPPHTYGYHVGFHASHTQKRIIP